MTEQYRIVKLRNTTLPGIEREVYRREYFRELHGLAVDDRRNHAIYVRDRPTPTKAVRILPAPAVAPPGANKICDGELIVDGQKISVTAFRLP